jgi:16S rRNA G966 N2-methylase RsmD
MRIGIDCRGLQEQHPSGVSFYTRELLHALVALPEATAQPRMNVEWEKFYNTDSDGLLLEQLAAQSFEFDLILTDPPYNLNKDFGNNSESRSSFC